MHYRFESQKATQVVASFIKMEGGSCNVMKLVKLVYLLDRLSIERRGIPVVGGDYFSMRNGPVISEILDLINSGELYQVETDWAKFISVREDNEICASCDAGVGSLSKSEMALMDEIYSVHGAKDKYELRNWCHDHLPEWHPISSGRKEIEIEDILSAVGAPAEAVRRILADADEFKRLDTMLA